MPNIMWESRYIPIRRLRVFRSPRLTGRVLIPARVSPFISLKSKMVEFIKSLTPKKVKTRAIGMIFPQLLPASPAIRIPHVSPTTRFLTPNPPLSLKTDFPILIPLLYPGFPSTHNEVGGFPTDMVQLFLFSSTSSLSSKLTQRYV